MIKRILVGEFIYTEQIDVQIVQPLWVILDFIVFFIIAPLGEASVSDSIDALAAVFMVGIFGPGTFGNVSFRIVGECTVGRITVTAGCGSNGCCSSIF